MSSHLSVVVCLGELFYCCCSMYILKAVYVYINSAYYHLCRLGQRVNVECIWSDIDYWPEVHLPKLKYFYVHVAQKNSQWNLLHRMLHRI